MLKNYLKKISEAEKQYQIAKDNGNAKDAIYWRRKMNDGYILLFLLPLAGYVIGFGGGLLLLKLFTLFS